MAGVAGWDIGAANIKVAFWEQKGIHAGKVRVASRPFEIWRAKDRLPEVLELAYKSIASDPLPEAMAVTMTAELSDVFETKREGVMYVLDCLTACFPGTVIYVLSLSGGFVPIAEAKARPVEFASSNWFASAQWVAGKVPDCLLVDVGSTTTDILPIMDGHVIVRGRTDLERLAFGELAYTGVLRTNLAAIVQSVPVAGRFCRVSSEYFAISGDVHLILGNLSVEDYTCSTPDGRPPSVDSARRRLARLVCADSGMISATEIDEMARYIHGQQIRQIRECFEQVISRLPLLRNRPTIVLGSGAFLGAAAAQSAGLRVGALETGLGAAELNVLPCIAAAQLLAEHVRLES
jgi:(4-(4-[2-(gamma-L-glutamylamino)ethyl]phenoxymethyl)furan-2-yl)methanamine synthase